jgi:NADP-dependent 3-hydroxy acid dehydrogenase YdfG
MPGKVLIYGGTGGIGSATAKALKARGFDLHLVARNQAKLEAAAQELGATTTAGDVTDPNLFAHAAEAAAASGLCAGSSTPSEPST